MTTYGDTLWTPKAERVKRAQITQFMRQITERYNIALDTYSDLYQWSVQSKESFWRELAEYAKVIWQDEPIAPCYAPPAGKILGGTWFPEGSLNYAENALWGDASKIAIIAHTESGTTRSLTYEELRRDVLLCQKALIHAGVHKGDRVAGVLCNTAEALIAMLATASLGAVWSSCSPDFGATGVIDRLGQITPKIIFISAAYDYNGKHFDLTPLYHDLKQKLPGHPEFVVIDHLHPDKPLPGVTTFTQFLAAARDHSPLTLTFTPCSFSDPLFILFSSGTTGIPKCIVHSVGGTLLQHKKELLLHCDVTEDDRLFYFTTLGWMMWNWMASTLTTGATVVLYEGSVGFPDLSRLWQFIEAEKVTIFGTSPKFIAACMGAGINPRTHLKSHTLKSLLSTGSPLLPEHFAWVYSSVQSDLHLASISGGTDIVSCFMLGNPISPVRAGEIQAPGLAMDIAAWDDSGHAVVGERGDLVCKSFFPSMPIGFWQDPDQKKYRAAYFARFSREVWCHGDYVEIKPHGGVIVYGRSDATLNPGGIRIGTAELYRQVEGLPGIQDTIAAALRKDGDDLVVLFIKLMPGTSWNDDIAKQIKSVIRQNLTPRHVPSFIEVVSDIPYTRSGKKVELAVMHALNNLPVKNVTAIANPDILAEYEAIGKKISQLS